MKLRLVLKLFRERLNPPLARMETRRDALEVTGRIMLCNKQLGPEHRPEMQSSKCCQQLPQSKRDLSTRVKLLNEIFYGLCCLKWGATSDPLAFGCPAGDIIPGIAWCCSTSQFPKFQKLGTPGTQQNREVIPLLELYPVTWTYSLCSILEPGPRFSPWLERIFIHLIHTSWVQDPP